MERLRTLKCGLDREFAEFKRTASQAASFADEAAGFLAAQFADVPSEQLSAQVGTAFAKVDRDGNGVLEGEEVKVAFAGLLGRRLSDDEVSLMIWDVFNKDDGHEAIDPVEFEHLVRYHLFVPCTEKCYVCEPSKRPPTINKTALSNSRPQSAKQQRCQNFTTCGFQGAVRAVATHELTCLASSESPGRAQGHCISAAHNFSQFSSPNGCACCGCGLCFASYLPLLQHSQCALRERGALETVREGRLRLPSKENGRHRP